MPDPAASSVPPAHAGAGGAGPASAWAPYPSGPYGTARGSTIANLSFLGWRHPAEANYDVKQLELVRLSDFYDPDGQSEIKLLAINASGVWCSACRSEYQDMHSTNIYETVHAKGIEILGALFEDQGHFPAQPQDLHNWGITPAHAVKFPMVLDPGFKLGAYFDSDATPLNMVVDVRTMTIVSVEMGYGDGYWTQVQALADKL